MACKQHTAALMNALRDNKLKVTPARLNLLDVFEHAEKPISVKELSGKLKNEAADKVTLYRNVETLEGLGLLKKVQLGDRQVYYERAGQKHHHHIVCTNCGKVSDITQCTVRITAKDAVKNAGFAEITDHSLEFFGLCSACAKQ